jgi:molybdopterin-guanine dinucleotide biosynthesis protein B
MATLQHGIHCRIIGFVGTSGSGKTTLIERLLPVLGARRIRVAVLKHAKLGFDMDRPGKDSFRFRDAGANQVMIASRDRWVLQAEQEDPLEEPSLEHSLGRFDWSLIDVVLVEGFSHEAYPKIEVYRPSRGRSPACWPHDAHVVAVASDEPIPNAAIPRLDLNAPAEIAEFIAHYLRLPIGDPIPEESL